MIRTGPRPAVVMRAVDALRTVEDADEQDADHVISGFSYLSKDGEPMKTFAPAILFAIAMALQA